MTLTDSSPMAGKFLNLFATIPGQSADVAESPLSSPEAEKANFIKHWITSCGALGHVPFDFQQFKFQVTSEPQKL